MLVLANTEYYNRVQRVNKLNLNYEIMKVLGSIMILAASAVISYKLSVFLHTTQWWWLLVIGYAIVLISTWFENR